MTQQYLCGELATRLGQLESASARQEPRCAVQQLRREAESSPPFALGAVAWQALQLADVLCWDALEQGDVAAFVEVAAIAAELLEFARCACLLGA